MERGARNRFPLLRLPVRALHPQQQMDMIGHNHILVQQDLTVHPGNLLNIILRDLSFMGKPHLDGGLSGGVWAPRPTHNHTAQQGLMGSDADCHKIASVLPIVIGF